MLVSHLGSDLSTSALFLSRTLFLSLTHTDTHARMRTSCSSLLYFSTATSVLFSVCMKTRTHTHTPDYRAIISSGVNLIVQASLSICPAMLHHDVVSQIHKRQNNVKKNIFIRIIYQNSKLYNCTIVQIAQMCTCGSLIYRYYVPVTLFF